MFVMDLLQYGSNKNKKLFAIILLKYLGFHIWHNYTQIENRKRKTKPTTLQHTLEGKSLVLFFLISNSQIISVEMKKTKRESLEYQPEVQKCTFLHSVVNKVELF